MSTEKIEPTFLTTSELAERWKMSDRGLEGMRLKGIGPTYCKIGSRVRYHMEDVRRHERAWRVSDIELGS